MALDFDTDLDTCLDTAEMAVSAAYTPFGGSASTINVILDNQVPVVNPYTGEVLGEEIQAVCKASDVPSAKHKDTLVVNSITYTVIEARPDGNGVTVLVLGR